MDKIQRDRARAADAGRYLPKQGNLQVSASCFCRGTISEAERPVTIDLTPQEISKPTPPAETTPP
jgi:hypothetical protein